ncbi:MAG: hypothetical protein KC503_09130 [Myxococcales bacterium]|nr:hypothetical protein [Myxococcales bacterium]
MTARRRIATAALALGLLAATTATAAPTRGAPSALGRFIAKQRPAVGHQRYLFGMRLPRFVDRIASKLRLPSKRRRRVVQVSNQTLGAFVDATKHDYLEVMVPKARGHVYFRYGEKVYDFYPGGFRVGGVRPIGSERYGMLVPLTTAQKSRLAAYLGALEADGGRRLGEYDFQGEKGLHCVSWMMQLAFGDKGQSLARTLGAKKDGMGMASFARFMLQKAAPVDAVVLYSDAKLDSKALDRHHFDIMKASDVRTQFAEGIARSEGKGH